MKNNGVRIGIDVGGTHTKAVAIDNSTYKIIGKFSVKTTHDDELGVARGVIDAFKNCLKVNNIDSKDVVFVAHSTTQATNALLEGDVAKVGVIGVVGRGIEGYLAKKQLKLKDIDLGTGRVIKIFNSIINEKDLTPKNVKKKIDELKNLGAQVIVTSKAFGVDDMSDELTVAKVSKEMGMPITIASDITKLYGLVRRTKTGAINASILPKMLEVSNSTEESIRSMGINVPLMIMRGDGGAMDIDEMRKRPILTMLSGPAASVMGTLMYLRVSNGIYFEVGGTSTNIGIIKNGRPAIDYSMVDGHKTYVPSIDVRVLGVAGGSMVRGNKNGVIDVGPRSSHIAGLDYAVFTPEEEIIEPQIELFSPVEGDPEDYIAIKLKSGKRITITNTCAANVLGLVKPDQFAYGNVNSARSAMKVVADYMGITIEDLATQILEKSFRKIEPVILELVQKYKLDKSQISLIGVGGGASSLIEYCAKKLNLNYNIPDNSEVISSIGVALSMIRESVERVIPNPTPQDVKNIRNEVINRVIDNGAESSTVDVHIEIDNTTSKIIAIATGSAEVKSTDLLKECNKEEAKELAAKDMSVNLIDVKLAEENKYFYVFFTNIKGKRLIRILDKKGFIRVQRNNGDILRVKAKDYEVAVKKLYEDLTVYKSDSVIRPDFYLCVGSRIMDFDSGTELKQNLMLMDLIVQDVKEEEEIFVIGVKNEI
ncbi:hydantoinase/oxoprolinase family protein [Clostridium nigeriense]|uniref:hydantoinase/oxoprolinase family protein n=1 Tax=Clostridium nigeriense TaxID=1805470 RepID=UPI003D33A930